MAVADSCAAWCPGAADEQCYTARAMGRLPEYPQYTRRSLEAAPAEVLLRADHPEWNSGGGKSSLSGTWKSGRTC